LDTIVAAHNNINSLRQVLRADGYIHGIITHGGDMSNTIPDYTANLFYVRAATEAYLGKLFDRVKKCAQGAALNTGTNFNVELEPPIIKPMRRNTVLEKALQVNMETFGIPIEQYEKVGPCSDVGNLSYYVPTIQPMLAIAGHEIPHHSTLFTEATASSRSGPVLLMAAKILAMTAYHYLHSSDLREQVKEEFSRSTQPSPPIRIC
jgi:metal-dependent amidase/aminoacylase/carboxypeptidase family protein